MATHYELHNKTLNSTLNRSFTTILSFSQDFLLSKGMIEKDLQKVPPKDLNSQRTMDNIIKDYNYSFIYVFDFLNLQEKIYFTGVHRGFKDVRLYLLNLIREEAISSLELRDGETLDDHITSFKKNHTEEDLTKPFIDFEISNNHRKTVLLLDQDLFSKLFKTPVLDEYLKDIYIIYRLLFILFGEHEIANIINDELFWLKCIQYLNTKSNGKIGSYIVERAKSFDFSHKSIYLMNRLLVGN